MTDYNDDRASSGDSGRPGWKKNDSNAETSGSARDSDRPQRSQSDRGDRSERPARDNNRPARAGDRPRSGDRGPRSGAPRGNDRGERGGDRRDDRGGRTSFPRNDRPGRAGEGREGAPRPDWQTRVERPRDPERAKSPMIPEDITENDLDLLVRVQMKTLSPENAERVARHLAMVNFLMDADPELAHQHAIAAADRAGRIGIVRETLALTAYTVGDFALALRELQAYRRISGKDDQLPIMVDCERGLGRPDKALELGRSIPREKLDVGVRVNLAIAMSGARLDKGQFDLALAELEIPELNPASVFDYSPHLFRAYAHTLEILGRVEDAQKWHDYADRAIGALEAKNAPAIETVKVIEEYVIPEPYTSGDEGRGEGRGDSRDRGSDRGSRDDRPRREFGSRDGGRDDRPRREFGSRDGGRDERPRGGDRDARPARPSRDFGGDRDRPRRDSDRPSGRPAGDRNRGAGEDRPKRDKYAGGFRIDHLDKPAKPAEERPADNSSDAADGPRAKWKKSSDE